MLTERMPRPKQRTKRLLFGWLHNDNPRAIELCMTGSEQAFVRSELLDLDSGIYTNPFTRLESNVLWVVENEIA